MDMITGRLINSLLQSTSTLSPSIEFYPGQIIRGQIMKHLPKGLAMIQIGNAQLVARMETELPVGGLTWLQVMQTGETTVLKVLSKQNRRSPADEVNHLGLGDSGESQQLVPATASSPLQQWLFHLPFNDSRENFVQIESQKQANGQIDPENCRLLFCFEMEHLGNVLVDLSITGKVVSIEVQGDHPELLSLSRLFREDLEASLREGGFSLTSMRTKDSPRSRKEKKLQNYATKPYKGVDIRI